MDIQPGLSDVEDLRLRLGSLGLNGPHRRFLVNRMGGTGSSWLVKLLNTHPDVFCYHEGVIIRTYPSSSYGSEDIVSFIRWLAADDMKGAYKAVGDIGSAWVGHLTSVPRELFTTGILLRHPARILNSRLNIFKTDKYFTEISSEYLQHIERTWGIDAPKRSEIDQIFLQDLCNLKAQMDAVNAVDVVMQLELMSRDSDYCQDMLGKLTGRFYERALIEPMLNNPVNSRAQGGASIADILAGFTADQRTWYHLLLQDSISKIGYELDNEVSAACFARSAFAGAGAEHSTPTPEQELNALKQMLVDKEREILRLERIWSAVQTSAGWRFLNLWRGARKWLLPAGTRARKVYDAVLRRYRRSTVVTQ
jgi:hypothetical protein